jgi:hypothetical protein
MQPVLGPVNIFFSIEHRFFSQKLFQSKTLGRKASSLLVLSSVADPDPNLHPDPPDSHVFGPPGSRSGYISQRYGSGSGSFYHEAKIGDPDPNPDPLV